ncbi:uncharacterized protein EI97DRAFT_235650 [Westerdykella ornata]|uniref:Uncharacterized protein n=1 Tax=Westerdykella ornata TaxID=318751 RepID=A0A6A6J8V1_WESOR|nr:uncharacterized protein EI97DRAFT_235650 [Westerdykella ornata]KAF2272066.1 hypothetical protein EI97DRAFT_235650 [Westerdykella ornata]
MFKPLSTNYTKELTEFMDKCQGLSSITKCDFFKLFFNAWNISFKAETIVKAFKATGIVPLDPNIILQRFNTKQLSRPSTSDSSTSVLSASDWQKVEWLLRQVVSDIYDNQAKKLSQMIHTISVQKSLLQHENKRLKEALINEKKRQQRSKPLLLQTPDKYHGGIMFWSPSKIQDTHLRQHQKELEEMEIQQQKNEAIKLRDEQKKNKAALLEERCHMRNAAKEMKDREKAIKAAAHEEEKLACQAKKQLQNDIKLSQKGNRQRLEPQSAAAPAGVAVDEVVATGAAIPCPQPQSRRERNINLPKRFQ